MIKLIDNDFPTLLGKLGAWPGEFGSQAAFALYDIIAKLPANSFVVDFDSTTGKSVVIAAAGARRSRSKLVVVVPQGFDPRWMDRALKLFALDDTQVLTTMGDSIHADLIICRRIDPLVMQKSIGGTCVVIGARGVSEIGGTGDFAVVDYSKMAHGGRVPEIPDAEIVSETPRSTLYTNSSAVIVADRADVVADDYTERERDALLARERDGNIPAELLEGRAGLRSVK
jgi:hypothetical protein